MRCYREDETIRKHWTLCPYVTLDNCNSWSLVTVSTLKNPFSNNRYDYWRNAHAVVTSLFWPSDTVVGGVTGWCVFDLCHLALNHWLTEVDVIVSSFECLKLVVHYHLITCLYSLLEVLNSFVTTKLEQQTSSQTDERPSVQDFRFHFLWKRLLNLTWQHSVLKSIISAAATANQIGSESSFTHMTG